eukprot:scaffold16044_cov67-Phaeocystis_antarctica.AAC.3
MRAYLAHDSGLSWEGLACAQQSSWLVACAPGAVVRARCGGRKVAVATGVVRTDATRLLWNRSHRLKQPCRCGAGQVSR